MVLNLPTLQQVLAGLGWVFKPCRVEIRSGHCLAPHLSHYSSADWLHLSFFLHP